MVEFKEEQLTQNNIILGVNNEQQDKIVSKFGEKYYINYNGEVIGFNIKTLTSEEIIDDLKALDLSVISSRKCRNKYRDFLECTYAGESEEGYFGFCEYMKLYQSELNKFNEFIPKIKELYYHYLKNKYDKDPNANVLFIKNSEKIFDNILIEMLKEYTLINLLSKRKNISNNILRTLNK